ncbi:hypothetical protein GCM10027203_60160 [Nonomuraea fastidiosa]|jgi:hypothetical protein
MATMVLFKDEELISALAEVRPSPPADSGRVRLGGQGRDA